MEKEAPTRELGSYDVCISVVGDKGNEGVLRLIKFE